MGHPQSRLTDLPKNFVLTSWLGSGCRAILPNGTSPEPALYDRERSRHYLACSRLVRAIPGSAQLTGLEPNRVSASAKDVGLDEAIGGRGCLFKSARYEPATMRTFVPWSSVSPFRQNATVAHPAPFPGKVRRSSARHSCGGYKAGMKLKEAVPLRARIYARERQCEWQRSRSLRRGLRSLERALTCKRVALR